MNRGVLYRLGAGVAVFAVFGLAGCGAIPPSDLVGPNGPDDTTAKCNVEFFNDDFVYGFDLPTLADLVRFDDDPDFLFNATWELILADSGIVFSTRVDPQDGRTLAEAVDALNRLIEADGGEFYTEASIVLANGDLGFLSTYVWTTDTGTTVNYRVNAMKHNRYYSVSALVAETGFTTDAETALSDAVQSLCIE